MTSPASTPPSTRFQPKLRYCHRRMSAPGVAQPPAADASLITRRSLRVRQGLWALLVLASLVVSLFVLWQLRGDLRPMSHPADGGEAAYTP